MSILSKMLGAGALLTLSTSFNQSAGSDVISDATVLHGTNAAALIIPDAVLDRKIASAVEPDLNGEVLQFRQSFARRVQFNDHSGRWKDCFSTKNRDYDPSRIRSLRLSSASHLLDKKPIIVLDPGHGHETPYSKSRYDTGAVREGVREVDIIDSVVSRLEVKLADELGADVIKTRDLIKNGLTLKERDSKFSNHATALQIRTELTSHLKDLYPNRPVLFISVHANSETGSTASGGIIFYYGSNGRNDSKASRDLASSIAQNYRLRARAKTKIAAGDFAVLRCQYNTTPSVLIELGYISNAKDRAAMKNATVLADNIVDGVGSYLRTIRKDLEPVQIAKIASP